MDHFRKYAFAEALAVAKELPFLRRTIRFDHLCVGILLVRGAHGRVITTSFGREVASTIVEYCRRVLLWWRQADLLRKLAGVFPGSSLPPLRQHQLILLLLLYFLDRLMVRQVAGLSERR